MTKTTVKAVATRGGIEIRLVESPYAEAQATIAELEKCGHRERAFRGVRFSRQTTSRLTEWMLPGHILTAYRAAGHADSVRSYPDHGPAVKMDVPSDSLAALLATAAEIERVVASAVPAREKFVCREAGCQTTVSQNNAYCPQCQHDA